MSGCRTEAVVWWMPVGKKLVDDSAEDGADVQGQGADEEDFIFFDEAGSAWFPDLVELEKGAGFASEDDGALWQAMGRKPLTMSSS